MSKQVQLRRGTTAEHATFTGAAGEVTVDITKNVVVVHDATTPGGHPMASGADLEAIITEINTPTTLTHTQTESVKSLPTGTLDGVVDNFETRGLSLVNSVVNGDFSDGTTGWMPQNGAITVTNKIATSTASGGAVSACIVHGGIPSSQGQKIFAYTKMKVTNSVCIKFRLHSYDGGDVVIKELLAPVSGQWYEVFGLFSKPTATPTYALYIYHYYPDAATANGKVMEVDGDAGVFAINMTALGIEDYTEAQMLDLVRGGYFDGLKGVENAEVKTVGKNLNSGFEIGGIDPVTGLNAAQTTRIRNSDFIRVNPSTFYTLSGLESYTWVCNFYDSNKSFIGYYVGAQPQTPANCAYIRFRSGADNESNIDASWQIEEGTVATAYEPHKSSHLTITPTLRSLPNGVHDRVYEADGQVWENKVAEEHALTTGDIIALITTLTNLDLVSISKPLDDVNYGNTVSLLGTKNLIIPGYGRYVTAVTDVATDAYTVHVASTTIYRIAVPKGTYANLAAAQAALAGTVIHYQLATPQLINLTEQGLTEGELMAFENGTVYLDADAFHVPSASFDVPTNTGAVIQSLVESANAQAKAIESKASKEQEDWIEPTLLNGWVNYGGGYNPAGYYKDEFGVVHLRGYVKLGTINTAIFTLTDGYKPLYTEKGVTLSNDAVASYLILSNGEVRVPIGHNTYVSLDGISFKAGE